MLFKLPQNLDLCSNLHLAILMARWELKLDNHRSKSEMYSQTESHKDYTEWLSKNSPLAQELENRIFFVKDLLRGSCASWSHQERVSYIVDLGVTI